MTLSKELRVCCLCLHGWSLCLPLLQPGHSLWPCPGYPSWLWQPGQPGTSFAWVTEQPHVGCSHAAPHYVGVFLPCGCILCLCAQDIPHAKIKAKWGPFLCEDVGIGAGCSWSKKVISFSQWGPALTKAGSHSKTRGCFPQLRLLPQEFCRPLGSFSSPLCVKYCPH